MSESKREVLVVLDLETTGLDPSSDEILEIAFIVVDNTTLEELGRFERVVRPQSLDMMRMHSKVLEMHSKSGLFDAARVAPDGIQYVAADAINKLADLVGRDRIGYITKDVRLILTGNTVHFDRSFLKEHVPNLERLFYHRHADVSAARTVLGAKAPGVDVAHRAMADCEMSLAELRSLRAAFQEKTSAL